MAVKSTHSLPQQWTELLEYGCYSGHSVECFYITFRILNVLQSSGVKGNIFLLASILETANFDHL
jgi:hypothetical protein